MANIMANDVCDLNCDYCFANEWVNGDTSSDITYENFKTAVDWINRSADLYGSDARIGIIGGEPLLHHDLETILEYAVMERRPKQEILVFTNGLHLEKYAEYFSRNDIQVLINLNSPDKMFGGGENGKKAYDKIKRNIVFARMKGMSPSIGVNYYKPDMDMGFVYELLEEIPFKTLRVGICAPNDDSKRNNGPFEYFNDIKEPFIEFARRLAEMGCSLHLDCQKFPQCIMGDSLDVFDEINREFKTNIEINECAKCIPVIDITTDLKVVRCFGMSKKEFTADLSQFNTEEDAAGYFNSIMDNMAMLIPMGEQCKTCYEKFVGKCQGGCLGFKLDRLVNTMGYGK